MTLGLGLIEEVPTPEVRPRRARRTTLRVLVAATLVALAANLIAAAVQPHLREPQAWPSAELQHKFDRIASLARTSRAGPGTGGTVLIGDSLLDAGADPGLITSAPQPVFNASLAGETLPVIAPWASRVVAPRLHPSLVVLGFTVNVLNGQMPGEATLVRSYERSRAVEAAEGHGDWADRMDAWLRSHVALYRDRSVLRSPFDSRADRKSVV